MRQKSSDPQAISFVSQPLKRDSQKDGDRDVQLEWWERAAADPALHTPDLGGRATTRDVTEAVVGFVRGQNA